MRVLFKIMSMFILPLILIWSAFAAEIWYEDNNLGKGGGMPADFIEKFHKPETFAQASKFIDVYLIRANVIEKLGDRFLTDVFSPYLKKNGIRLAINSGAATYIQMNNRRNVFDRNVETLRRLKRLGLTPHYISLQSALSKIPKVNGQRVDYPLEKRVQDIVHFSMAAKEIYPEVEIGLIDALLSHGKEYRQPYLDVKAALAREGLRLSYFHLDISFDAPRTSRHGVTWESIKELEAFVENDLGSRFGLFSNSRRGGKKSSKAFHQSVMSTMECYMAVEGTPGEFIIASWFPHPEKSIPEYATGDDYPAMRTVLEFGLRLESIEKSDPLLRRPRASTSEWRSLCTA